MPQRTSKTGSELFIVDNSDADWKAVRYLHDWCGISRQLDIATAYFEIGSLLALNGKWKDLAKIRILMGDEVSKRTQRAFEEGLACIRRRLDDSLESEKQKSDFLDGVALIVQALADRQIECRVYRKEKFHAKAYITHAKEAVVGSAALVGSSNFTRPGLTENVELNVQITGGPVTVLQEWYDEHWRAAEDVTPEILRTIERHTREYTPFEVYAKALQEYFKGHEMTADEWELAGPHHGGSRVYPILDQYQKEGYRNLLKIARQHRGAFLCDGVGLGKTFIGLMLIERLIRDKKNVMLIVPKAAREAVWEPVIHRHLRHLSGPDFSSLAVFSHTDLQRGGQFPHRFAKMKELADAVVIDEAHHFRNPGPLGDAPIPDIDSKPGQIIGAGIVRPSRYRQLYDIIEGPDGVKELYLLTATPINNKLADFRHMVELFSRRTEDHFSGIGVQSLRGHFLKMERDLKRIMSGATGDADATTTDLAEAEKVLTHDALFNALVVQRSRAYVKQSQIQNGGTTAMFPEREPPKVANYSIKKTYGKLLDMVDGAFNRDKPLFALAMYYPLFYYKGSNKQIDPFAENRQKQVVGLIRAQFLKRFESSARSFERSCERLLVKLLAFWTKHAETDAEKRNLDRWKRQNADLIGYVQEHQHELWGEDESDETDDLVDEDMLDDVQYLDRAEYRIEEMLDETHFDLDEIAKFLAELQKFKPRHDNKLQGLIKLLKSDSVLSTHKVLVFTEFADTGRYLQQELESAGVQGLDRVDGQTKRNRTDILRAFAPYYNGSSSADLQRRGIAETRILISTDVLSEGLNLQDATRLINYDLHWNPVRLMQRIGRVDRRMSTETEAKLLHDHPDQKDLRGRVAYWNFLPPDELDILLRLYGRVAHKTLRISKTLGIETGKLLRPDDDYEVLKNFNETYEGTTTPIEAMHLEFQRLVRADPGLAKRLDALPGRVFSGKAHPSPDARAVFFCFALPGRDLTADAPAGGNGGTWTEEAGRTIWLLHDVQTDQIIEDTAAIVDLIRSTPEAPRRLAIPKQTLAEIRAKVERHIKNTHLKQMQAPMGVKPVLKCWMELN